MSKQNESIPKESAAENKVEFKKEIGVFGGVSILGGIMIGSGIFYLGAYTLQRTGMSMGLSLVAWIFGGLLSMLGGLCYAELGASDPKAGGSQVYLSRAYHPLVGFLSGFSSWLLSGAGSISAIAVALPTTLRSFFDLSDTAIKAIAIVLIIFFTILNLRGVKLGSAIQNVSMVAKLIPLVIILVGALIFGKQSPDLSLTPLDGSTANGFFGMMGLVSFATIAALWAYEGWTNLNTVAEEIKEPHKNLPLAIIVAIGGITVLYTLFNYAIYKFLPHSDMVAMINAGDNYLGTEVAKRLIPGFGNTLVTITMVVAMLGSLNGMVLAFPRMYYAMAKEGHFFKAYGKLHPKTSVPHVSIIGQCVIASILILFRNLDQLTSLVVFSGMIFKVLVVFAVIRYRKLFPDMERPYKVWGYPVTVIIAIILDLYLMYNTFVGDPVTAITGLSVPVVGVLVYFIFDKRLKNEKALAGNK